jgi:DNA repair protein SbcD/Mre11
MIRILLLADTHLCFDLPLRPRVERRRRGEDFFANFERALQPALTGQVDLVVHGGDVFHRPRVSRELAVRAVRPLLAVADRGVPVFIVPGNHERSRLPARFGQHRGIHVFDRPRTYVTAFRGIRVGLAGFPFERRSIRTAFTRVVQATRWRAPRCDIALLCIHHCVEGATVGPGDFTFRRAPDVIRGRDIPPQFAAVLSGHIHRRQVLTTDLGGRPMAAPVLYPGSIERTSAAEKGESKGYFVVEVTGSAGETRVGWHAEPLPARPMYTHAIDLIGLDAGAIESRLRTIVEASPRDAVVRIRLIGEGLAGSDRVLSAARVREMAPATMNIELTWPDRRAQARPRDRKRRLPAPQLDLSLPHA